MREVRGMEHIDSSTPLSGLWKKYGFTDARIAELTGASEQLVHDWVSGVSLPTVSQIFMISQACQCDISDIFLALIRTPLRKRGT